MSNQIGCNKLIGENEETYYEIRCDKNYMLCSDCKERKKKLSIK